MTFSYLDYKGFKAPIIPVALRGRARWNFTTAYVDSGATFSVFKAEEAQRLGVDINKGEKQFVVVGDGSFIPVYLHKIRLRIGEDEIDAVVSFSDRLGVGFNLLGRKSIFNQFDVTFSDCKETITFSRCPKKSDN